MGAVAIAALPCPVAIGGAAPLLAIHAATYIGLYQILPRNSVLFAAALEQHSDRSGALTAAVEGRTAS